MTNYTRPRNRDWSKVPAKHKECQWLQSYIAIIKPAGTISARDLYDKAPDVVDAPPTWTTDMKATAVRSAIDLLEDLGAIETSPGTITWIGGE